MFAMKYSCLNWNSNDLFHSTMWVIKYKISMEMLVLLGWHVICQWQLNYRHTLRNASIEPWQRAVVECHKHSCLFCRPNPFIDTWKYKKVLGGKLGGWLKREQIRLELNWLCSRIWTLHIVYDASKHRFQRCIWFAVFANVYCLKMNAFHTIWLQLFNMNRFTNLANEFKNWKFTVNELLCLLPKSWAAPI